MKSTEIEAKAEAKAKAEEAATEEENRRQKDRETEKEQSLWSGFWIENVFMHSAMDSEGCYILNSAL